MNSGKRMQKMQEAVRANESKGNREYCKSFLIKISKFSEWLIKLKSDSIVLYEHFGSVITAIEMQNFCKKDASSRSFSRERWLTFQVNKFM